MKREKGFTLIELLSVVVVLGITFMFVLPKLVGLISDGEEKEIELIEERVLSAAKDYVNYMDGSFYTKLFKEGDTNYIYKTDLIKSGLLDKEEITKLDTFAGVKGELLEDDKIKYTVEYINAEPEEYTNEELYLMIQNMGGGSSSGGGVNTDDIDDLQSQINENKNSIQNNTTSIENNTNSINTLKDKNSFLDAYPVGSIYISDTNTNPSTIYGGTWTLIDKRFKPLATNESNGEKVFFSPNSTNVSDYDIYLVRVGNTIRIRLHLVPAVILNDTTYEMGNLNYSSLGINNVSMSLTYVTCLSDGGNGMAYGTLNYSTGLLEIGDVLTKTSGETIAAGASMYCSFNIPVMPNQILDSATGEFHFKRTA